MLASFFTPKSDTYLTPLQIAAGRSVYSIVVDTQRTGRAILDDKSLKERIELIPLDTISPRAVPRAVVARAKQIGGEENVDLALSLIDYDPKFSRAVQYAFGGTLVCKNSAVAQKVTFAPDVRTKSVTLAGDLFNPLGTLTGGSLGTGNTNAFRALVEQKTVLGKIAEKQKELDGVDAKIRGAEEQQERARECKRKLSVLEHELGILKAEMEHSKYSRMLQSAGELEKALHGQREQLGREQEREGAERKKVERLETELNGKGDANVESKLKEIEKNMAAAKSLLGGLTRTFKQSEAEQEKLKIELDSLRNEKEALSAQLESCAAAIRAAEDEAKNVRRERAALQDEHDTAKTTLEAKRTEFQSQTTAIKELLKTQRAITDEENAVKTQLQKGRAHCARLREEKQTTKGALADLTKANSWIKEDEAMFGVAGGDYDFTAQPIPQLKKKLQALGEEQDGIAKSINKKVIGMFERAEQEYDDLVSKKQIIEKDKQKIQDVIQELDEKKREALTSTYQKVNKDFGSVFQTLLPGTQAKLMPPEGKTIFDGLEVKVAFGDDWKENLTELSGGQRSLLALSLILAILLFHPAPMYILDEVDAALDPSHTQNIGAMLKSHFKQSQFIVVSLKKGMFQNANVLFQTRCVDGVSSVTRSAREKYSRQSKEERPPMKRAKNE
jgi:structural maintenance of chromosome 2